MGKRSIDRAQKGDGIRTRVFLDIDRKSGGAGQREKALFRGASDDKDAGERTREFTRIERESSED